jgi:hypothetical protein
MSRGHAVPGDQSGQGRPGDPHGGEEVDVEQAAPFSVLDVEEPVDGGGGAVAAPDVVDEHIEVARLLDQPADPAGGGEIRRYGVRPGRRQLWRDGPGRPDDPGALRDEGASGSQADPPARPGDEDCSHIRSMS